MSSLGSSLDKIITVNSEKSYPKDSLWIKGGLVGLTLDESAAGGSLAVGLDGVVSLLKNDANESISTGDPLYGVDASHTIVSTPDATRSSFIGFATQDSQSGMERVDTLLAYQPPGMAASGAGFDLIWAQVQANGQLLRGNGIGRTRTLSGSVYEITFSNAFSNTNYAVSADPMNHDNVLRYSISNKRTDSFRITWQETDETSSSGNFRSDFIVIVLPG